jgi:hypothetical protein
MIDLLPDSRVALRSHHGTYLRARADGRLVADSLSMQDTARLHMIDNGDCTKSFKTVYGTYLAAVHVSVQVAAVETRINSSTYTMQGVPGLSVKNLGFQRKWHGFETKVDLYIDWVRERAESGAEARNGELLILVDGLDVAWGGCSLTDLVARYHTVVDASAGPKVVVGADNQIWPPADWNYLPFKKRREKVQATFGLSADNFNPAPYRYANSGFLMGPATELLRVLKCVKAEGVSKGATWLDDQYGLTSCLMHHADWITIDYSSSLSLQLADMSLEVAEHRDGHVHNNAAGVTQCFIHGNGKSLPSFWDKLFPGRTRLMESLGLLDKNGRVSNSSRLLLPQEAMHAAYTYSINGSSRESAWDQAFG